MSSGLTNHVAVMLDACCIINLAATGEFDNIVRSLAVRSLVSSYVVQYEVLSYIDNDDDEIEIDLSPSIKKQVIAEVGLDLSTEAEADYILYFEQNRLDPGESETAAIAINRGWAVATDDKRAITLIRSVSASTQILTTPELIKHWADEMQLPPIKLKQILGSIRKYVPPKNHPLRAWWVDSLK